MSHSDGKTTHVRLPQHFGTHCDTRDLLAISSRSSRDLLAICARSHAISWRRRRDSRDEHVVSARPVRDLMRDRRRAGATFGAVLVLAVREPIEGLARLIVVVVADLPRSRRDLPAICPRRGCYFAAISAICERDLYAISARSLRDLARSAGNSCDAGS